VRGEILEQQMGHNVPPTFTGIDIWDPASGLATSIKSLDTAAPSYLEPAELTREVRRLVDKVANFKGARRAGLEIDASQIRSRALKLAVPPGKGTPAQQQAFQAVVEYASQKGVTLNIVEIE
jgi:filamentous hemagglutinin